MNPIVKLFAIIATAVVAVTAVFVAVALAIAPTNPQAAGIETNAIAGGAANLTPADVVHPLATAKETDAFYAHLAPKVGDEVGGSKIAFVKSTGLGCYEYSFEGKPDQPVAYCSDVSAQSFEAWVLEYRKTH